MRILREVDNGHFHAACLQPYRLEEVVIFDGRGVYYNGLRMHKRVDVVLKPVRRFTFTAIHEEIYDIHNARVAARANLASVDLAG